MADREMQDFLAGVVGVVEATSFESLCLWQRHHKDRGRSWEEGRSGPLVTVGQCDGKPVCISLFVHVIDGHRIAFIEDTSQVVDHRLIDAWLLKNLPITARRAGSEYINKVDAMNFYNVFPRRAAAQEPGAQQGQSSAREGAERSE